ncbi:DoxX family protein [Phyllobacterium sp. SB3]|uniref:DoxX family protein n=1 Tax=Phyllobacterium sp. SB3 TaxID=3156073 RepID=UPI0032AFB1A9
MENIAHNTNLSGKALWTGRILSGIFILFMIFDGGIKLVPLDIVLQTSAEMGLPATVGFARGLGILALLCTALYAYPRTSILGAILLTGYMGGAILTQLRIGNPLFSHLLFGVYLGLIMWGGLYLRDRRLRALIPFN